MRAPYTHIYVYNIPTFRNTHVNAHIGNSGFEPGKLINFAGGISRRERYVCLCSDRTAEKMKRAKPRLGARAVDPLAPPTGLIRGPTRARRPRYYSSPVPGGARELGL